MRKIGPQSISMEDSVARHVGTRIERIDDWIGNGKTG